MKRRKINTIILCLSCILSFFLFTGCSSPRPDPAEYENEIAGLQQAHRARIRAGNPVGTLNGETVVLGDTVFMGSFEQDGIHENGTEPIEWRVLNAADGKILLVSERILARRKYHERKENHIQWEMCDLRKWLNGDFVKKAFSESEQNKIAITHLGASDSVRSKYYPEEYAHLRDTDDKVFLLDKEDALIFFEDDQDRISRPTPASDDELIEIFAAEYPGSAEKYAADVRAGKEDFGWFLRYHPETPDTSRMLVPITDGNMFCYSGNCQYPYCVDWVSPKGEIDAEDDMDPYVGIRPAMWVNPDPADPDA